jgi:hypothetical protein
MLTLLQLPIVVPYICLSQNHFYEVCLKISEMEENGYQLIQQELEVHEVMKVHREEGVLPSIYPCSEFMSAAGILQDFQTLISNAGLEHFIDGEPHQYAKLTMSVVQDFRFSWSLPNPMVHHKIYNKTVDLPLDVFYAAIRVPQWGSHGRIKERPRTLMDLYEEICQGRSFSGENGKIQNIHFPSIRYFAYFIAKCVLARKTSNKLSSYDLTFISTALRKDRTYNLSALISFRLAANREKGGVCGRLIASRLLALHGVAPHDLDIQFPIEKLDLNSMIHYKFVSSQAWLGNLSYEIAFLKKSAWRVVKTDQSVHLPAPLFFNLDGRNGWSVTEDECDAYMEEHPQHGHEDGEGTEDNSVQPSSTWEFPYQQSYFNQGPSASSS